MITEQKTIPFSETALIADRIRLRVFAHVLKNNGGYMSQACSSADILAALYTQIMKLHRSEGLPIPLPFQGVPGKPGVEYKRGGVYNGRWDPDTDIFIFSPSHYGLVLYATLIEVGRMAPEGLDQFNRDGSVVEMISAEHSPGVETTTGSLGQAISQAGGIALGRSMRGESGRVWVMMTDGEFQEGQVWESVMTMANFGQDNIGVYIDVNGQQCDGKMEETMQIGDLRKKLESFGAKAVVVDGHDVEALTVAAGESHEGKPLFVLAKTDPTHKLGILKQRAPKLHYLRFVNEQEKAAYEEAYETMKREVLRGNR